MLSNSDTLALLRLAERLDCKLSTSNDAGVSDGYNQIVLNERAGLVADFFGVEPADFFGAVAGVECAIGFRWDDEDCVNVFAPSLTLALDRALVEMRDMGGVFERLVAHLDWDAVLA